MNEISHVLIILVETILVFAAFGLGLKYLGSQHPPYYKAVLVLLLLSGTNDVVMLALFYMFRVSNVSLLHIYTFAEFVLLALLYWSVFQNSVFKKAAVFSIAAFSVFKLADLLFITDINQPDTVAMSIESIMMMAFSMLYFGQLIAQRDIKLVRFPMFWINTAILFYFAGSFFLFLYSEYIFSDVNTYYGYWWIHNTLVIIRNILFLIAMVLLGRPEASYARRDEELIVHE